MASIGMKPLRADPHREIINRPIKGGAISRDRVRIRHKQLIDSVPRVVLGLNIWERG